MPIYEYQAEKNGCDHCRMAFEVMQSLNDAELTECPRCGCAVGRIFSVPGRPGRNIMSNSSLAEKGFTKYKKRSDGRYTRECGPGPEI